MQNSPFAIFHYFMVASKHQGRRQAQRSARSVACSPPAPPPWGSGQSFPNIALSPGQQRRYPLNGFRPDSQTQTVCPASPPAGEGRMGTDRKQL